MSGPVAAQCPCKVGRAADDYGLPRLQDDIVRRREEEDASLRDLAGFVNERILERALADAGTDVAGDPQSVYEALAGDDAGPGRRTEVRRQLRRAGVPVETVESDFVSHQTVRDHLRDCLGMDTGRRATTDLDDAADLVGWARDRNEGIIDDTLARLRSAGTLETGRLDVTHSVRVTCEDCGATYRVTDLLERGACDCADADRRP